jgi:hypothetical protein
MVDSLQFSKVDQLANLVRQRHLWRAPECEECPMFPTSALNKGTSSSKAQLSAATNIQRMIEHP